jgi:serine/threonine protein kinase
MMSDRNEKESIGRHEAGPYRGEFKAEFCRDAAFLAAVSYPEDIWSRPEAALLHDKRNRVGTLRIVLSSGFGREFVVKEFPSRGLPRMKSFFQPSKAARAWQGALALERNGLGTAAPAGFLEKRKRGFVERSFFFAARIDGAEEVRGLFRRLPAAELEPLLSGLAKFLSRCHDRGVLHRDLSDGNVLVKKDEVGRREFFLLDTNRIRRVGKLGGLRRSKNLIRLGVPPGFQEYFLRAYYGEKPLPKPAWLWYKTNKAVFASYANVKKKLRLRQIARFLRIQ